jgi:hypothetical protein
MERTFIIIIFSILFSGLFFFKEGDAMGERKPSHKKSLSEVNLSDGVDKEEAIILAQNYLVNTGRDDFLITSKPKVFEKHAYGANYWRVTFPTTPKVQREQGLEWGALIVDKETGKVQYLGEGPS